MSIKNIVENELRQIERSINLSDIERLAKDLVDQRILNNTSKIGAEIGSVAAGFRALTTAVDDVVSSIPTSVPQNITDKLVIAEMTEKVPGMTSRLKQPVGSAAGDLQMITGTSSAVAPAMLNVVVGMPTPESVAAAVKQTVPTANVGELQNIASNTLDLTKRAGVDTFQGDYDFDLNADGIQQALNNSIATVTNPGGGLPALRNQITQVINQGASKALAQATKGFGSLIENTIEKVLSPASNSINSVATINGVKQTIPESELTRIISLTAKSDYDNAIKLVRKYSDQPDDQIFNILRSIDNKLSSTDLHLRLVFQLTQRTWKVLRIVGQLLMLQNKRLN